MSSTEWCGAVRWPGIASYARFQAKNKQLKRGQVVEWKTGWWQWKDAGKVGQKGEAKALINPQTEANKGHVIGQMS